MSPALSFKAVSIDPSKLFNFGVLLNICLRLGPSPSVPFDIRDPNEMTVSSLSASIIASRGRDIERRAKRHDLPWSGIPPYPIKHLPFANRIALIGAKDGAHNTPRRPISDGSSRVKTQALNRICRVHCRTSVKIPVG
jgi:hypothetical protein